MNIEYFLHNFTGFGVTAALIDTGVMIDNENISHYKFTDDDIVACDISHIKNTHGTKCASTILRLAPNIALYDICVETENVITEQNIIKALEFLKNVRECDVICICLTLENYSNSLMQIIDKLANVFIFSFGYKDRVSYPADLEKVIKVYYDKRVEDFTIVSKNIISSNCSKEKSKGNSLACAFIAGAFSTFLEARCLWRFEDIYEYVFCDKTNKSKNDVIRLPQLSKPFVASFPMLYLKYSDIFNENVLGYLDNDNKPHYFRELINDCNTYVHINPYEYPKVATSLLDLF